MGFFNRIFNGPISAWPYTNLQNLNLDWLIGVCKEIKEQWPAEYEKLLKEIENKLGKPINDGNIGDLLVNIGEGKSQWKPFEDAIATTIIGAVNAWLVAHPEYVTTVQDGAISPAKLDTELYKLYKDAGNVQIFIPGILGNTSQGNCSLIVTPNKTILMDAHAAVNENAIIDYLTTLYNAEVFTNIDYIIISHYHYDHIENLESILTAFPHLNCKMYIPLSPSGYYAASIAPGLINNYDSVVRTANDFNIDYTVVNEDINLVVDNLVRIELFNSNTTNYEYYSNHQHVYNNYSMVALVEIGKCYALFPGDLERAGQEKVLTQRTLPRVDFYLVHHHGVQTDDYIPYINMISPLYSLVPNDHSVAINQSLRGIFQKMTTGFLGASGYSNYAFVFNNAGCSIIDGTSIPNAGSVSATATLYVDNSYTGDKHDGSFDHPFVNIAEALQFVKEGTGISYEISVFGTETAYPGFNARNINVPIRIAAYNTNNIPEIASANIENCSNFALANLKLRGAGLENVPQSGHYSTMRIINSYVVFNTVEFDGSINTANATAISCNNSSIRLSNSPFHDYVNCFRHYTIDAFSTIAISGNNSKFKNISGFIVAQQNIKFFLFGGCTLENVTKILATSDRPIPAVFYKTFLTPENAALCQNEAITEIGYKDSTHPAVIIVNSKLYDVLTGNEIT